MHVLGLSGSISTASQNLAFLRQLETGPVEGVEFAIFSGLGDLPIFAPHAAPTPAVDRWRESLRAADAVLIASPEYGHSLPGGLKNAIDWVIGSGELYQKPVAITASVPGAQRGRLGLAALAQTLRAVDVRLVGGEPIVRGPESDGELRRLVHALVACARARPELV